MATQKPVQTDSKVKYYVFQDERFVDLNLYQFGWERCRPMYQFGPAVRNHFLFHYIINGKGKLETSGQTFFYRPARASSSAPGRSAPITQMSRIRGNTPGWSLAACAPGSA